MLDEAAKTTEAAVKATAEARRQADIAELSIRNLERPYLFPEIVRPDRRKDGGTYKAYLRYRFINYGRTLAVLRSVSVRLESAPELPLRLPLVINTDVYEVVSPGEPTEERRVYIDDTSLSEPWSGVEATKLIFHGSISYGDMAGTQHTDYFCLRANENAKGFVMEGGEAYNRRTSVGPSMEIERPEE